MIKKVPQELPSRCLDDRFLDALASLKPVVSVTNQFQIAEITIESISENEIVLCQYHYRQCQCCQCLQYQRQYHHSSIISTSTSSISTSYSTLEIKILTSSAGQFKSQMSKVKSQQKSTKVNKSQQNSSNAKRQISNSNLNVKSADLVRS